MTKYDNAIDLAKPSLVIQGRLFEKILLPVIGTPTKRFAEYFYHQAYEGWRYDVTHEDLDNLLFVERLCDELYRSHKQEFLELASAVMEDYNNVSDILHESERRYYEAEEDGSDAKLKSALDHYKTFFEAALRLWSSVPYFYAVRVLGNKSEAKQAADFLRVSSGEKFQCLRQRTVYLPQKVKLSDLVSIFSNQLRNAGGGHDSYEFLDNGSVKLHISNPKSGKTKTEVLTYGDIKNQIEEARKAIWILRNGFMSFLNRNPKILEEVSSTKVLKLREIKGMLEGKAKDFVFNLVDFSFDDKQGGLTLTLEKRKRFGGRSSEVLFGNGQRFEVITIATEVKLEQQLFGVLQYASHLMGDHYPLKQLTLIFLDEGGVRYNATFTADAVKQASKKDKALPQPLSGELPTGTYDLHSPISVPYGLGGKMEVELRLKGYRVVS